MEVELAEVRDFLAGHAPFDRLPGSELAALPRRCTIRYARRGSVVLDVGDRGDGLYVVRSGAVEVREGPPSWSTGSAPARPPSWSSGWAGRCCCAT